MDAMNVYPMVIKAAEYKGIKAWTFLMMLFADAVDSFFLFFPN